MIKKIIFCALYSTLAVCVGLIIDYTLSTNRKILIYPISAHTIKSDSLCMEAFCVYNYRWKNEAEIIDSILAYDARTIPKDSVMKYTKLYRRTFLKNKGEIHKGYINRHDIESVYYMPDYSLLTIYREVYENKRVDIYTSNTDHHYSIELNDPNCWYKILNLKHIITDNISP